MLRVLTPMDAAPCVLGYQTDNLMGAGPLSQILNEIYNGT
jgi:hypothetical protein